MYPIFSVPTFDSQAKLVFINWFCPCHTGHNDTRNALIFSQPVLGSANLIHERSQIPSTDLCCNCFWFKENYCRSWHSTSHSRRRSPNSIFVLAASSTALEIPPPWWSPRTVRCIMARVWRVAERNGVKSVTRLLLKRTSSSNNLFSTAAPVFHANFWRILMGTKLVECSPELL